MGFFSDIGDVLSNGWSGLTGGENKMGLLGTGYYNPTESAMLPAQMDLQKQMAENLTGLVNGSRPSIAGQQLQMAQEKNLADTTGLLKASNINPTLQARLVEQAQGAKAGENARQGALMKSQEIQGAINNYGNFLSGVRGQDQNQQQMESNAFNQAASNRTGLLSGAGQAGVTAAVLSDKNEKKNIKSGSKEIGSFLDALKAKKYDYKDEKNGKGKQVGVMAQDLEKTELGKAFVTKGQDGQKMVDYGKGFGALLAAQAEINERLKKLEGMKK